jgi:hypothetical protein
MVAKFEHTPNGERLPARRFPRFEEAAMDDPKSDRREFQRTVDLEAKLLAVLDQAEAYRVLAIKSRNRGERESYENIVELYVRIAEQLEAIIEG